MTRVDVPDRVRRAVARLDVQPDDRLLEIGCGGGVAVALICERLSEGTITAIDRSPLQVERAARRNEAHIASGRATVLVGEPEDVELEDGAFTKVFAINVNLFWVRSPRKELDRIRQLLRPNGALYLFYDPPDPARATGIADKLMAGLEASGFRATPAVEPEGSSYVLSVEARAL